MWLFYHDNAVLCKSREELLQWFPRLWQDSLYIVLCNYIKSCEMWRHDMETFSTLYAFCKRNPPDTDWFQRTNNVYSTRTNLNNDQSAWNSNFKNHVLPELFAQYNDVIMGAMASQITSLMIVYSTVYSDSDQRKHQSSVSLACVRGNSPVTGELPEQMASNAENVVIWWRHHGWSSNHFEILHGVR